MDTSSITIVKPRLKQQQEQQLDKLTTCTTCTTGTTDGNDTTTPIKATREPPKHPQIQVLYYSEGRYLCVNKPYDVRIDGDFEHTVEKLSRAYIVKRHQQHSTTVNEDDITIRFIQRLDYATSGVLLLGLSKVAASIACNQFEARTVRKHYLALVHNHLSTNELEINKPIADGVPAGSYHMQIGTDEHKGRQSITTVRVVATGTYHGHNVTKVLLMPKTGRRHQLRVHLKAIGFPIVGDATYAQGEEFDERWGKDFIVHRMMLHAQYLKLKLPADGSVIHGRKSALRTAVDMEFESDDPFTEETLEGLKLSRGDCSPKLKS